MSYHENSRFINSYSALTSQDKRGMKRPLANKQPRQNTNEIWNNISNYHESRPGYSMGINVNTYGYASDVPVQGHSAMNSTTQTSGHSNYTPSSGVNAFVNSVFDKISNKYLGNDGNSMTYNSHASNQSSLTTVSSSNNNLVQIPTTSKDTFAFKKPDLLPPKLIQKFKEPLITAPPPPPPKPKVIEKPKKHISAKAMWEMSYKKEVTKTKPDESIINSPNNDPNVINIVPITEDTSFMFEGVPDFYRDKVKNMFSITECKICKSIFDTAISAKKHYTSTYGKHGKNLSKFLVSNLEPGFGFDVDGKTDNVIDIEPKSKKAKKALTVADNLMCTLCNVQLENEGSAKNHFDSKGHKQKVKEFLNIDDNIIDIPLKDPTTLPTNTPPCLSWNEIAETENSNTVKICRLCSVKMSSLISSKDHYSGKSHKKRIRLAKQHKLPTVKKFKKTNFVSGGTLSMETNRLLYEQYKRACENQVNQTSIFGAESTWLKPNYGRFSNCMTPSGHFYCTICNITLPSREKLMHHELSKQHRLEKSRIKSPYE